MAFGHGLVLILTLIVTVQGFDPYENSFISPNSAADLKDGERLDQQGTTLITSAPENIQPSASIPTYEERVKRSPEPILSKTIDLDHLPTFKNVEDSLNDNHVEFSARTPINPSRTETLWHSGEVPGAPQGRDLKEPPHDIIPTATLATATTSSTAETQQPRQNSHDIQDIITGIVKLLNGNVNVQANTAPTITALGGRPLRPLSTRINNRGPPRITDLPPLPPDFDVPAPPFPPPPLGQVPPTRLPTPYPFDVPPHNTSPVKRPGLYRPATIPPWKRPPNRRPIGNVPPYKPLPIDSIHFTTEKPMGDILTLDLGSQLQPEEEEVKNGTEEIAVHDQETIEFEKNKEKSSYKMNKHTSVVPSSTEDSTILLESTTSSASSTLSSTTSTSLNDTVTSTNIVGTNSTSVEHTIVPSSTSSSLIITTPVINSTSVLVQNNSTTIEFKGDATPVLESSIHELISSSKDSGSSTTALSSSTATEQLPKISTTKTEVINVSSSASTAVNASGNTSIDGFPYYPYRPRPGIVLDDTEYKPGGANRPIITRPPNPLGQLGDIFDITVSAIQGPGGASAAQGKPYVIPVDIDNVQHDVITSPVGDEGFVSIDGKRTYLNLFGESTSAAPVIKPSAAASSNQVTGTGYAVVDDKAKPPIHGSVKPTQRRPIYGRPRPSQPPVRIDTCIVGDDSTCDGTQHEICRTEAGVSACHCRPGHARRKHRDPCRKIVSVLLSLRVDRLYERRIVWAEELADKSSDSYQQLSYEAERALDSAMSMTPFSDDFLGAKVNRIYRGERSAGQAGVFVNMTLQLDETAETARASIRADIQKHLLGVIQRRSNNVGNSALWVDSPPGSISNLQDVDECSEPELHDCHALATCVNIFGGFKCECAEGLRDPWLDNKHRAGRHCEQCSSQRCNNRGECKYQNGQEVCICSGNYYGSQCELDGEVLGVAIGASVAAVIIIGLTLVCLVMWSRRWSREQKAAVGSPVFGYMATASNTVKAPVMGAPPYQLTLEDRLRWAQIADVMAQSNHYAPEPVTCPVTRPSSAMFGIPTLTGTLQHGTLPPVPLPRLNLQAQMASRAASIHGMAGMRPLDNSSSSEEEDKADLLGRHFQVPRPKSRSNASIANQSGIYYDVDYDQNEMYKQSAGIPLSTYSMTRPAYYRN